MQRQLLLCSCIVRIFYLEMSPPPAHDCNGPPFVTKFPQSDGELGLFPGTFEGGLENERPTLSCRLTIYMYTLKALLSAPLKV